LGCDVLAVQSVDKLLFNHVWIVSGEELCVLGEDALVLFEGFLELEKFIV
jgi:hypothetical protein